MSDLPTRLDCATIEDAPLKSKHETRDRANNGEYSMTAIENQLSKDIETLLMALYNSDEWDDIEHQEILDRWRANRGDAGKSEWTWWAGEIDGECYSVEASCDKDTRYGIIEMARNEMPDDCQAIEIIQARIWHDEIEGDEIKQFAETRYHEVVDIRVRAVKQGQI